MEKSRILLLLLLLSAGYTAYSQSTIRLAGPPGVGGPPGSGPSVANQFFIFHNDAATASNPSTTFTLSLSNQQFLSVEGDPSSPGTSFGSTGTTGISLVPGFSLYSLMSTAGLVSSDFTACSSCPAGTGIDVTTTGAAELQNIADALITSAGVQLQPLNARVHYSDLTVTFNRPVSNPVLHVGDLGGHIFYNTTIAGITTNYDLGMTTDIDLITPGLTLAKLSGNAVLQVTPTSVSNSGTRFGPPVLHGIPRSTASGSVRITGTNITSVTFRLFLRGDGGIVVNNSGVPVPPNNGNIVRWAFHNGFIPGGVATPLIGVNGDAILVGFSLQRPVTVNGNVFNDPDAGNVNNSTGNANAIPAGLHANLVDANGRVVATTPVATDGTYSFAAIFEGDYTVSLSTVAGVQSFAKPAESLMPGYMNTGEFNGFPNTGNDGTSNGLSAVFTVAAADVTNINFGIQRLPESAFNQQPPGANPGSFNSVGLPAAAFQVNTIGVSPSTSDYDGGQVDNIRITAFPSNVNSISVNGINYVQFPADCPPLTFCTLWPAGGVVIPYTDGVGVAQPVSIDPVDGDVNVVIPFVAIDNGGSEDATPGMVTKRFFNLLPLQLLSFNGVVIGAEVLLQWKTANEIGFADFVVEWSADGLNWQSVERVPGGNSTLQYTLKHRPAARNNYYRLRMNDTDGDYSYSQVINIRTTESRSVLIFPNPATSLITVLMPGQGQSRISVFDMAGKRVYSSGTTNRGSFTFSIDHWPAGLYSAEIEQNGNIYHEKIIKN